MTRLSPDSYKLEPAAAEHGQWLYQLYESSMRPVIEGAVGWVDVEQRQRFARSYSIEQFQLISVGTLLAGALYTVAEPEKLHLSLLLIHADFRNRSLGTQVIESLQAQQDRRPITLSVFKNNPALSLYNRLGFRIDAEDDHFFEMSWRP